MEELKEIQRLQQQITLNAKEDKNDDYKENSSNKNTNKKPTNTCSVKRVKKTPEYISKNLENSQINSENNLSKENSNELIESIESKENAEFITESFCNNRSHRKTIETVESETPASKCVNVNMIVQYSREFLCFLALILTTYATFQNSQQPKISGAPIPKPIFDKYSFVKEWPNGQLRYLPSSSELTLVYFYAPWCSESLFARTFFNSAAEIYQKEVFFAAINCWQPSGECRALYPKVYKWPVVAAFLPNGLSVQYFGGWDLNSISQFIEGLLLPIVRVHNNQELSRLRIENDAVVLGIFKKADSAKYRRFFETALKWLEVDPLQHVKFAVYIGMQSNIMLDSTHDVLPIIKLFNFNQTLIFDEKGRWDVEKIVRWIQKYSAKSMIWIDLPYTSKSSPLTPYFKKGPILIMFTPKTMLSNEYLMMKQVIFMFRNCQNDPSWDFLNNYIPFLRSENRKKIERLIEYCRKANNNQNIDTNDSLCSHDQNQIYQGNKFPSNTSIVKNRNTSFCRAQTFTQSLMECKYRKAYQRMAQEERITDDIRSPGGILKSQIERNCKKISKQISLIAEIEMKEEIVSQANFENFKGLQCKYNRTLSFLLLDKLLHYDFELKIVGNQDANPTLTSPSVFILDDKDESVFKMETQLSVPNLMSFIEGYFNGSLKRHQRSTTQANNYSQLSSNTTVRIEDLNSQKFQEILQWKNATLVVIIYSAQCALCTVMSQILLQVMIMTIWNKIHYYRIDANANDLQWEYTMETYPTLLIFPRNKSAETKVFPPMLRIDEKNIFGFIVANMEPVEQLKALLGACAKTKLPIPFYNCLRRVYPRIDEVINRQLRIWREHLPLRSKTLERLKILKEMYLELQLAKNACDVKNIFQSKDYLSLLDDPQ